MASTEEIQTLLRFLSQDAKVPLAAAIGKVKELQKANLGSPSQISQSTILELQKVFTDGKVAKQVFNAARRLTKKRAAHDAPVSPAKKRRKASPSLQSAQTPAGLEASLELPTASMAEEELSKVVLYTNRAPLVLAFAVKLLENTMPEQPLSSRLSLAQAVVSANSRTKAVSLGLESGKSADEEGWGEGQPAVKIMGREVKVMKRWDYDWDHPESKVEDDASQKSSRTIKAEEPSEERAKEPALWGLDLEHMRKKQGANAKTLSGATSQLPIHTPQSARAYLLKSFECPPSSPGGPRSETKPGLTAKIAEKERNLGLLLGALDLLYRSWRGLDREELDKRAWSWYVRVRPDVPTGVAGWGGKGKVKLSDILELRR